jgi:hypothetical protein
LSASAEISNSNSKEWAWRPEDLIKLVVMEPVPRSYNRHEMGLSEMFEYPGYFRITKGTFIPSQQ